LVGSYITNILAKTACFLCHIGTYLPKYTKAGIAMENEMGIAVGHLAPMEVKRNAYMIVVEKPEG
jgi:hypothetical protein